MRWRRRRADPAEPEQPKDPQAHIVKRGGVANAKRGESVQALCGAPIAGDPSAEDAPVCQDCVVAQFQVDDRASDEQATTRYNAGRTAGVTEGRRQEANEIRTLAAEQERREREQLEAARFEVINDGQAVRFRFEDGTDATVRLDHVGSVLLDERDGLHRAVVDGYVLIAHADEALVRRHHDQVHELVFGSKVPAALAS